MDIMEEQKSSAPTPYTVQEAREDRLATPPEGVTSPVVLRRKEKRKARVAGHIVDPQQWAMRYADEHLTLIDERSIFNEHGEESIEEIEVSETFTELLNARSYLAEACVDLRNGKALSTDKRREAKLAEAEE